MISKLWGCPPFQGSRLHRRWGHANLHAPLGHRPIDQAEASGTPFADGIGEQIRDLAGRLSSEQFSPLFVVESMCPPEPPSGETAATVATIMAVLEPPNATELSRTETTTFTSYTYESTESMQALKSFYDSGIPQTGYEVTAYYDDGDRGMRWILQPVTSRFGWTVVLTPVDTGIEVSISFTGEP